MRLLLVGSPSYTPSPLPPPLPPPLRAQNFLLLLLLFALKELVAHHASQFDNVSSRDFVRFRAFQFQRAENFKADRRAFPPAAHEQN